MKAGHNGLLACRLQTLLLLLLLTAVVIVGRCYSSNRMRDDDGGDKLDAMLSYDYYTLLDINRHDVNKSLLKRQYRKKAMSCHPDKFADEKLKHKAGKVFIRITDAYKTLSDGLERFVYDQDLSNTERKREGGKSGSTGTGSGSSSSHRRSDSNSNESYRAYHNKMFEEALKKARAIFEEAFGSPFNVEDLQRSTTTSSFSSSSSSYTTTTSSSNSSSNSEEVVSSSESTSVNQRRVNGETQTVVARVLTSKDKNGRLKTTTTTSVYKGSSQNPSDLISTVQVADDGTQSNCAAIEEF